MFLLGIISLSFRSIVDPFSSDDVFVGEYLGCTCTCTYTSDRQQKSKDAEIGTPSQAKTMVFNQIAYK
jgi:hypothetical protein